MPRFFQRLSFCLLALLFGSAAEAAAPSCDKSAQLRSLVKDCEDNIVYARAGKACLESYDAAILAARARVAESLKAVVNAEQQSAGLENAKKGYTQAIAALKELVKQGLKFEKEVASYKNEVVLPEDFGSATEAGLPAEEFLRHQSCYSETQKLIQQHARNIALTARQLELTAQISEELARKAFRGESGLKNQDILPLLQPGKAATGAGTGAGKNPPEAKSGKSDITGTKKTDKP